jgi:hypothetical protein
VTRITVDRSILEGESVELFRAAIKSPATRDPYERRLINFLKTISLTPDDFIDLANKDPSLVERKIFMNQFLHQIYKKINVSFVKNLPIIIVLTVVIVMSGYVLTIGNSIKQIIINYKIE